MLDRNGYIASGILHVGVLVLLLLGLPNVFRHHLPEETPLVVQLVKLGPVTRATRLTKTPPVPDAKPDVAEDVPAPKPLPPAPEPPKIIPNPQPPQLMTPPDPQLATPEPPPPPAPQPKPLPAAPLPPVPTPKPEAPPQAKPISVPVPQPKPQPPKPKVNQQAFNTLLKNLEKNQPTQTATDQPKTANSSHHASSQPIAPLGAELTASELDLVKQQIYQCWNVPLGARDANDLTPEFRVTMNRDASVQSVVLLNTERYGDPNFRAAADSARRALFNPQCTPLKLPLDKYNEWQTFTITFDPKDVAG